MSTQLCLSSLLLAEFSARKIGAPTIAWINRERFSEPDVIDNAYCIPNSRESEADYLPEQRIYTADRYGGYGVGYCGGSARCGTYGGVQVKGVGLTPLLGSRADAPLDPWHSSGTVTMNEAGREAIWSGICDAALPFGAVPTLALVLTGSKCLRTDTAPGVVVLNRRALVMRSLALRPGHFMRNVHFKTPLVVGSGVCEDFLRVRQMIQTLPEAFEQAFGAQVNGVSVTAQVSAGLRLMAGRFATQVAAAFAKRLYHGSLNCTNIALDGRYLDFGTMTAVSAYCRQASTPLWSDLWTQHTPLLRTLSYLLFHVGKHLDCPDIKALVSVPELTAEFNAVFSSRSEIELLKQTGVPEQVISDYDPVRRSRAYRCFKAVYMRGADTSFVWRGEDDPSMVGVKPLQRLGSYDLNQILTLAARCSDAAQLHRTIETLIDDTALAAEFHAVYSHLVEWYLCTQSGIDAVVARQFLARQAARLNADVSHLTREALDAGMAMFEEDPSGLGAHIDNTIRVARQILDDVPPALVGVNGQPIESLSAQLNALKQMKQHEAKAVLAASPLQCVTTETNARLGTLCAIA